jgi:hypothetical protein
MEGRVSAAGDTIDRMAIGFVDAKDIPLRRPTLIGARFEVQDMLGAGGSGIVWKCLDRTSQRSVAVKIISVKNTEHHRRYLREVHALRLLRLPGIACLIDTGKYGEHEEYIAMEMAEGKPWPGEPGYYDWKRIAPQVVSLFEAVGRLHERGIIHRDLKPSNVFVDSKGRCTVLDFGVARGPALGQSQITAANAMIGTPRYFSPEQLQGRNHDQRSDLYAIGLMLYETLAGRNPHAIGGVMDMYALRVTRDAPPIEHSNVNLPPRAAAMINALLARTPERRPRTAGEALGMLGADIKQAQAWDELPLVGRVDFVDHLVREIDAGHSVALRGERASGKSRVLSELGRRLQAAGRPVAWAAAGARPLDSLRDIIDPVPAGHDGRAWAVQELTRRAAEGLVVIADDGVTLDRTSAECLRLAQARGGVVRISEEADALPIPPVDAAQLGVLFNGPDRIFHLREDGARELWTRCGNDWAHLSAEVRSWVAAGVANWDDARLTISRSIIEQLESGLAVSIPTLPPAPDGGKLSHPLEDLLGWITLAFPHGSAAFLARVAKLPEWEIGIELDELTEMGAIRRREDGVFVAVRTAALSEWTEERLLLAHRSIAEALPAGHPRRLAHLVAGEHWKLLAAEALAHAEARRDEARVGRAIGALSTALALTRDLRDAERDGALLDAITDAALHNNTLESADRALGEFDKVETDAGASRPGQRTVLQAARLALQGRYAEAAIGTAEPCPAAPAFVETWRLALLSYAQIFSTPDAVDGTIEEIERRSAELPDLAAVALARRGLRAYLAGDYAQAVVLQRTAADLRRDPASRLLTRSMIASALLELGELDAAEALAAELNAAGRETRNTVLEARSEWLGRACRYRRGEQFAADRELVEVVGCFEQPALLGTVSCTEAAIALRGRELRSAIALAATAEAAFGRCRLPDAALLARVLGWCAGHPHETDEYEALVASAGKATAWGLGLQTLALAALRRPPRREDCAALARLVLERAPWPLPHRHLEVLAVDRCLEYLALSWSDS